MPTSETATLHLERHSPMADSLRACSVSVGAREVGHVGNGEARTFSIPTGPQDIELRMGSTESNTIPLCVRSGETLVLQCGAPKRIPADVAAILRGLHLPLILWPAFDLALAWFSRGFVLATSLAKLSRRADPIARCRDALASFDAGLATRDDALGHFHGAMAAAQLSLPESDVVARFDRSIALDPNYADAHLNRGLALRSDACDALGSIERAIELDPGFARAHFRRAELLHAAGRHEDALAAAERVLELDRTLFEAYEIRRLALLALGRPDPSDAEFGQRVLAEFMRLQGGYGMLPYRVIQDIKSMDRSGFAQMAKVHGNEERVDHVSPEQVATRLHAFMVRPQQLPYGAYDALRVFRLAMLGITRSSGF